MNRPRIFVLVEALAAFLRRSGTSGCLMRGIGEACFGDEPRVRLGWAISKMIFHQPFRARLVFD